MLSKSNKRRRIAADACTTIICPLYDLLPEKMLEEVASFLAAPSRVLFAIAITPPSSISPYHMIMARSRPNVSRSSIAGNEWHTLDFGDVEKELAAKLSDDDISKVLLHIDAANKLKILRLTNCSNMTGAGLVSLSGSTSIEQIDLSLVGAHQSPILDPKPPLDCDLVLPILDSIINQGRCQLKHLQFPRMWRGGDYDQFNEFL
mmetsp:Transcript_5263/g.11114  ORF Transcript_5263/g.11114 Transcript_5263/m.11114 type:complete len:204 (+) Transcript_5263:72-683(+)